MAQASTHIRPKTPSQPLSAIAIEAAVPPALLAIGLLSGSLTLLGEGLRSGLLLVLRIWPRVGVLRGTENTPRHYEFGLGKLEQSGNLVIALLLMSVGLWFASLSLGSMFANGSGAGTLGLALAAAALALQLCRRTLSLRLLVDLSRRLGTPAAKAAAKGSIFELAYLILLQLALSVAVLSRDPLVSHWADLLGGCAAASVMAVSGIRRSWEAVMDLIDYPFAALDREVITELFEKQNLDVGRLVSVRARRAGRHVFVELTLELDDAQILEEVQDGLGRLCHALRGELNDNDLDVAIRLGRTV